MTKTKYLVLARRYRPQTFEQVVGQEAIVTTLKNALRFDKVAHAYLFCGSRGVGKTTLARLFAKALNCEARTPDLEPCNNCASCKEIGTGQSLDVIEIDGASNRGIDDIRQINETIAYAPSQGRFKIYIIDEVHMLTKEAFNALLKTLEEPPEKVKFFFATTEPHKVLPTIISRCQRFDLGRIPLSKITAKLEQIATDLNRTVELGAFHLIASFSDGSLRDAESLFDQILCFAEGTVTADIIRETLGLISQDYFFKLDQAFSQCNTTYAFDLVSSLFTSGKDLGHFYEQLIEHVRLVALAKTIGEKGLELPSDLSAKYLESAKLYTAGQCLYLLDYLLKTEQQIQRSVSQRVSLEATLLHYIQSKNRIPVEILVRKLAELEEKIKEKGIGPETEAPRNTRTAPSRDLPKETVIIKEMDSNKPCCKEQRIDLEEASPLPNSELNTPPIKEEVFFKQDSYFEVPPRTPNNDASRFLSKNQEKQELIIEKPPKVEPALSPALKPKTETLPPVQTISPPEIKKTIAKPNTPSLAEDKHSEPLHHPSHYDTLIRFAAVELEGTVKKT